MNKNKLSFLLTMFIFLVNVSTVVMGASPRDVLGNVALIRYSNFELFIIYLPLILAVILFLSIIIRLVKNRKNDEMDHKNITIKAIIIIILLVIFQILKVFTSVPHTGNPVID